MGVIMASFDVNAELNRTDKMFIAAYIRKKCNGTKAWKEISDDPGISDNVAASMASQTLTKVKVREAIDKKLQQIAEAAEVDAVWALTKRKEIVERSMQDRAVTDSEGNEIGEYVFDANAANQALTAIEKLHLNMSEKTTVDVSISNLANQLDSALKKERTPDESTGNP